jgi:ABC-type Fe3+-hydroxamate transport system substrate-binding protein
MKMLGEIFQQRSKSERLITNIKEAYKHFPVKGNGAKVVYLIWKNPWMAAGKNTFIGSMLQIAGFENIVEGRYPVVDLEMFKQAEEILLATEPYHFKEKDRDKLLDLFPEKRVNIVNGELFTWFGTFLFDYAKNKLK